MLSILKKISMIFNPTMKLILNENSIQFFLNNEPIPSNMLFNASSFIENPDHFEKELVNEFRHIVRTTTFKFAVLMPKLILEFKGKLESQVNNDTFIRIFDRVLPCRELIIYPSNMRYRRIGRGPLQGKVKNIL